MEGLFLFSVCLLGRRIAKFSFTLQRYGRLRSQTGPDTDPLTRFPQIKHEFMPPAAPGDDTFSLQALYINRQPLAGGAGSFILQRLP
jgi:hypothetical protein